MPIVIKGWRRYAVAVLSITTYLSAYIVAKRFVLENPNLTPGQHDVVPIYDEDGKFEGFTHPTLVAAGNKLREAARKKES